MSRITKREHPRITQRVNLREYHQDLADDYIDVWVNIDRELRNGLLEGRQEAASIGMLPLTAEEERETRLAALIDRMKELHAVWWGLEREDVDYLYAVDVPLYQWIVGKANEARDAYEGERKKVDEQ